MVQPSNRRLVTEQALTVFAGTIRQPREISFVGLSTWSATYTGVRPNVTVYLSGEEVDADVIASGGNISVTFPTPSTGTLVIS